MHSIDGNMAVTNVLYRTWFIRVWKTCDNLQKSGILYGQRKPGEPGQVREFCQNFPLKILQYLIIAPCLYHHFFGDAQNSREKNLFITLKVRKNIRSQEKFYFFVRENLENSGSSVTFNSWQPWWYDDLISGQRFDLFVQLYIGFKHYAYIHYFVDKKISKKWIYINWIMNLFIITYMYVCLLTLTESKYFFIVLEN